MEFTKLGAFLVVSSIVYLLNLSLRLGQLPQYGIEPESLYHWEVIVSFRSLTRKYTELPKLLCY